MIKRFAQKLYYLFLAIFAVLFIGMLLYVYWIQTRGIKNRLAPKFDQLTEMLVAENERLLENRNPGSLNTVLNDIVRENGAAGRLAYLRMLDQNYNIFLRNGCLTSQA